MGGWTHNQRSDAAQVDRQILILSKHAGKIMRLNPSRRNGNETQGENIYRHLLDLVRPQLRQADMWRVDTFHATPGSKVTCIAKVHSGDGRSGDTVELVRLYCNNDWMKTRHIVHKD